MAEHFNPNGCPLNNAAEVTGALATCKRCGDDKVSWKKSARTGRFYLCDVEKCGRWYTRENPVFRYFQLARTLHKCPARAAV